MSTLKLLRLFPVISSTVNLMWAHDEYAFLSSWMSSSYRAQADTLLPSWFKTWLQKGVWFPLGVSFPATVAVGLANIFTDRAGLEAVGALKWYWMGVGFTVAHFLYGPKAMRLLAAIQAGGQDGKATKPMGEWLRMHLTRIIIADLPAFICFTVAASKV
ncbi:hypothetical protein DFH07DRAFT_916324 [Mycena maculata]|uniref:Integral membrane protein n=1 Tax=Mycena maculata TaxID=230809 RepID=A0AAD7NLF8_9AGAR|nr:hypothetical protein DFH07DRAFT_916324 [Mycena maculata]